MRLRLTFPLACIAVASIVAAISAQSPAQVLAPTGTLRAVFLGMNPVQGRIDPQTGKALGPVPDIVEALAKKLGVPFTMIAAPNAAGVTKSLNTREADIGVLAYDEERTRDVDYGAPLYVMLNSYLVRANSAIRRSSDVDRAGVRVAAVRGQTQELWASSHLKNAKVRVLDTMPTPDEVAWLLMRGGAEGVEAFAINRQRSLDAEAESGGQLRALADSFLQVDQSFVVRKGDREKLPSLEAFAKEVRTSGLVKASIARAKLTGVEVAR